MLFLLCASCTKMEDPIGNFPVYLRLDLTTKDKELREENAPGCKIYTQQNINANFERAGFGGVLVVRTVTGSMQAFDLACPYEASRNVLIAPDENTIYAVCPDCGTKYDIAFGTGAPDGVSRFYLKRYNVVGSGSQLTVTN
jgi:NAD-dependent SIR2 family protein deacetylase